MRYQSANSAPFTRAAAAIALTLSCVLGANTTVCAQAEDDLKNFEVRIETFPAPSIEAGESEYAVYLPKGWDGAGQSAKNEAAKNEAAKNEAAKNEAGENEAGENEAVEKTSTTQAPKTYPLAIWLHGMNGSYRRFHRNDGPQILDQLRSEKKIEDMIFVAVSAARRPVYLDGLNSGDFQKLILNDLIKHLESHYPVAKTPSQRAIMGVSMGGMGALTMALGTEVFGTVAAHSSCILPENFTDVKGRMSQRISRGAERMGLGHVIEDPKEWAKVSPMALVKNTDLKRLKSLNIYFDAGDADRYGFGPANEALHNLLDERKVDHTFELVEGGEHAWGSGSTQRQLPKSLEFVSRSFRSAPKQAAAVEASSKPTSKPSTDGH